MLGFKVKNCFGNAKFGKVAFDSTLSLLSPRFDSTLLIPQLVDLSRHFLSGQALGWFEVIKLFEQEINCHEQWLSYLRCFFVYGLFVGSFVFCLFVHRHIICWDQLYCQVSVHEMQLNCGELCFLCGGFINCTNLCFVFFLLQLIIVRVCT